MKLTDAQWEILRVAFRSRSVAPTGKGDLGGIPGRCSKVSFGF